MVSRKIYLLLETGTPRIVYGNMMNRGLIDNLPRDVMWKCTG